MLADKRSLKPEQVCRLLAVSRNTLRRLVKAKRFPAPIRVTPNCLRWDEAEVAAFLAKAKRRT